MGNLLARYGPELTALTVVLGGYRQCRAQSPTGGCPEQVKPSNFVLVVHYFLHIFWRQRIFGKFIHCGSEYCGCRGLKLRVVEFSSSVCCQLEVAQLRKVAHQLAQPHRNMRHQSNLLVATPTSLVDLRQNADSNANVAFAMSAPDGEIQSDGLRSNGETNLNARDGAERALQSESERYCYQLGFQLLGCANAGSRRL